MRALLLPSLLVALGRCVAYADSAPPADPRLAIDRLLDEATRTSHPFALRASFGNRALVELKPLLAASSSDAELHWMAARAWSAVAEERGMMPLAPAAAARQREELLAVRRLAPEGGHAADVAMELAFLASKDGRFGDALAEYDRALADHALGGPWCCGGRDPLEHPAGRASMLLTNSAEMLMALGRLDEAIARYQRAVEHTARSHSLSSLPWWGLAVALDRDRQEERARAAVAQALVRDPEMGDLADRHVFFVPAGEKEYYLGLGYLQRDKLEAADAAFREYLASKPRAAYAARAQAHVDALKGHLGE